MSSAVPHAAARAAAPPVFRRELRQQVGDVPGFVRVDTRDPDAVQREVEAICTAMYPAGDHGFVARAFGWARDCFEGRHPGYLPIDARYHDLEHTMQGTIGLLYDEFAEAEKFPDAPLPGVPLPQRRRADAQHAGVLGTLRAAEDQRRFSRAARLSQRSLPRRAQFVRAADREEPAAAQQQLAAKPAT